MKTLAIDYETDWSKDYSVAEMGTWAYVRDPRFRAHTVSMVGDSGLEYAGPPEQAPWDKAAEFPQWVSHHAGFDSEVHARLGLPKPKRWNCTADLAAYGQHPRSLAGAAQIALGITLDKSIRDRMTGDLFVTQADVDQYALDDAKACLGLWKKWGHAWPDWEALLSRHTRVMAQRGIGFDRQGACKALDKLARKIMAVEKKLPWVASGKPPTSRLELVAECSRLGITPPASTAEKSPEWAEWLEVNEKALPWARELNNWRKLNRTRAVIEAMLARSSEDRLHSPLKYYGAAVTGRWSGSDGLNLQNFNAKESGGVDVRALLRPAPGKKFVVADLSQIEPRCLAVLCGDGALLEQIRAGYSLYESHARATMFWDHGNLKTEAPKTYALAKARVLGLGYGAGPDTFRRVAKVMCGLNLDEDDAKTTVEEFRATNPSIVNFWNHQQGRFDEAGACLRLHTPAGRALRYFNPAGGECQVVKGGKSVRYWGSKLTENIVQATARDVMGSMILSIERAGLPVVMHVHDEVVVEVDETSAEDALAEVLRIMHTPPDWLPALPVAAEGKILEAYEK